MGKLHLKYNAKARSNTKNTKTSTKIDEGTAEKRIDSSEMETKGWIVDETDSYRNTSIPLILPSKSKKRSKDEILDSLPDAPSGKMTGKKLKRLEKFIERELKKENRKGILSYLK